MEFSENARKTLVAITRNSLRQAVTGGEYVPEDPGMEELNRTGGCFVTYKTGGQLRGCLGCFTADDPLYRTVARYARASATEDPRFFGNRLTEADLPRVELDISVLSPLEPCPDPYAIELGRHGIYVRKGWQSGCFLPQVATETGWSVEEFWGYCCSHKAGLPADAWKSDDIERYTFTAEVIEDPAPGQ